MASCQLSTPYLHKYNESAYRAPPTPASFVFPLLALANQFRESFLPSCKCDVLKWDDYPKRKRRHYHSQHNKLRTHLRENSFPREREIFQFKSRVCVRWHCAAASKKRPKWNEKCRCVCMGLESWCNANGNVKCDDITQQSIKFLFHLCMSHLRSISTLKPRERNGSARK